MTPLSKTRFSVEYAIVTKNDSGLKSKALPLFSRVSLRRACQSLISMKTPVTVHLVEDQGQAKSREKPRKKRQNRATP